MKSETWSIDDGHGNELTTGLQWHNRHRVAQQLADKRGESVWLYKIGADEDGEGDDREEVEPSESL